MKGIGWAFNKLKYLAGFLHLKPTAGYHISKLIFGKQIVDGKVMHRVPRQIQISKLIFDTLLWA
jgi:hypothetical protein